MDRYGKGIRFFVPYAHFDWYPATRCVFVANGDQPISRECFNLAQAREQASLYLASIQKEES